MSGADHHTPRLIDDPDIIRSEARKIGLAMEAVDMAESPSTPMRILMSELFGSKVEGKTIKEPPRLPQSWNPYKSLQEIDWLRDGCVRGETRLFKNEIWTSNMVHCSDLLLPASILMQELVDQKDAIDYVSSFRIYSLIKAEMTLYGKVSSQLGDVLNQEPDQPSFSITFRTKMGNNIAIAGFQTGGEIPVATGKNTTLDDASIDFPNYNFSNNEAKFNINPSPQLELGGRLEFVMPLSSMATSIDLVILAITSAKEELLTKRFADSSYRLAAGFERFVVPQISDILAGGSLSIKKPSLDKIKVTKAGYEIIPMHFEFQNYNGRVVGGGIFNIAIPQSKEIGINHYMHR